jgi:hypothetical protein
MYLRLILMTSLLAFMWACTSSDASAPIRVEPAADESMQATEVRHDGVQDTSPRFDEEEVSIAAEDTPQRPDSQGRAGVSDNTSSGGLWAVDALDEPVGLLVRRGSDDNLADRAIYDLVTLYHPESNLFFEVTMTDAKPRYPTTTFFSTASCETPVGISAGGCLDCRSGSGIGFVHGDMWWRVASGKLFEQASAGSSQGGGIDEACTAHQTFNAKVFPVEQVTGPTPATDWEAPLHFEWR